MSKHVTSYWKNSKCPSVMTIFDLKKNLKIILKCQSVVAIWTIDEKFLSKFWKSMEKFTKIKSSQYTWMLWLKKFKVQKT